jgi:hypothetical protein
VIFHISATSVIILTFIIHNIIKRPINRQFILCTYLIAVNFSTVLLLFDEVHRLILRKKSPLFNDIVLKHIHIIACNCTYILCFTSEGVEEVSQIFVWDAYQNDSVWEMLARQMVSSSPSDDRLLVAFYDIHGRKGEVLICCLVSNTTSSSSAY